MVAEEEMEKMKKGNYKIKNKWGNVKFHKSKLFSGGR
jgi:hypothetical protein